MENKVLRGLFAGETFGGNDVVEFLSVPQNMESIKSMIDIFNKQVVSYAPGLEEIDFSDILTAYKAGKLSETKRESLKGFLKFAQEYISIKILVLQEVEETVQKEISADEPWVQEVLTQYLRENKPGFTGLENLEVSGSFEATEKKVEKNNLQLDSLKGITPSADSAEDMVLKTQDDLVHIVSQVIGTISTNLASENLEYTREDLSSYIKRLADIDIPLDKELLKTIPLDLSQRDQKEVIITLLKEIFPSVNEGNYSLIYTLLDVYPRIGKGQKSGVKFGQSVSVSHLSSIMKQDNADPTKEKFNTLSISRIIVPIRFLYHYDSMNKLFLDGDDSSIQLPFTDFLESQERSGMLEKDIYSLEDFTSILFTLDAGKVKTLFKEFLVYISGKDPSKLSFSHMDEVVKKYTGNIEGHDFQNTTPISQLFNEKGGCKFTYEKAREFVLAMVHITNLKNIYTDAKELLDPKRKKTVVADPQNILEEQQEEEPFSLEEVMFFIDNFETSDDQLEDDVQFMKECFDKLSEEDKNRLIQKYDIVDNDFRAFMQDQHNQRQVFESLLRNYDVLSAPGSKKEVKQRAFNKIKEKYLLVSDDRKREFHELIDVSMQKDDDELFNALYKKFFNIRDNAAEKAAVLEKNKQKESYARDAVGLRNYLLDNKKSLTNGKIKSTFKNYFLNSFNGFSSDEKRRLLLEIFGNYFDGGNIDKGKINIKLGVSLNGNDKFYTDLVEFLKENTQEITVPKKMVEIIIKLYV